MLPRITAKKQSWFLITFVQRHLKEHYTVKQSLTAFHPAGFFFLHVAENVKLKERRLGSSWLVRSQSAQSPAACLLVRYKCILDFASGSLPATRKHVPYHSYITDSQTQFQYSEPHRVQSTVIPLTTLCDSLVRGFGEKQTQSASSESNNTYRWKWCKLWHTYIITIAMMYFIAIVRGSHHSMVIF